MDLLHKNIEKWLLKYPEDRKLMEGLETLSQPFSVNSCTANSGLPNLKIDFPPKGDGPIYLHSQNDPVGEAKEWFASLYLANVDVIYVYGIGLGYYYDAALSWLKENRDHYLVFIEDDPQVMRRFFETERCSEMLDNTQVFICMMGHRSGQVIQFTRLTSLFNSLKFIYTGLKSYENLKFDLHHEYKSTVSFLTTMGSMLHSESASHGLAFFRNFYLNLLDIPRSYLGNDLKDKFKGVPAIICGAGPSLNKNMDVLATLYDRALIFAGGTALNALNGKGVMPHFGVGIDPNPDQFTRLVMNHAFELPFLYRCRMLHEALEMVHGDRLYLSGSGGYEIGKWYENKLGVDEIPLQEGFNVLNFSVVIAHLMGCNPIICAGIDLAYSEGDSYASGVTNHPIHSRKANFRTKNIGDELISKNDIHGKPVLTLWKWIAESMWYTQFAESHPDCTLINATEGGIGFPNVTNMTLAEVKEKYLYKQLDLKSHLHNEIQNSPLPAAFNEKNIIGLTSSLMESLAKCGDICQELVAQLAEREKVPAAVASTKEFEEEKGRLLDEMAFNVILKRFHDDYLARNALVFKRLENEKEKLAEEEYVRKKAVLDQGLYQSLRETCLFNTGMVKDILAYHEKVKERLQDECKRNDNAAQKLREEYVLPCPKPDEIYLFDGKTFAMKDPELHLDYTEDLSKLEDKIAKETTYYPSKQLKSEKNYLKNNLHGPVTFYSENGTILSTAWYVNGRQEGKMWTYYPKGQLHSLQRFEKGLMIGVHQYFYANGLPKSILPYQAGVLHGEVHLFGPEGHLARRLNFVKGKRTGQEQIWNEAGDLVIECQFEADKPVGLARMWHPNGVLAKEFIYDKDNRRIEAKEWTPEGELIVQEEGADDDYFDKVNKETDKLTASLGDMVHKMSEITPIISEKFHVESPSSSNLQSDLAQELANLQKELERLQSIDGKLKEQLGMQTDKEAIWKTPSSRREMERQFEGMRDKINSGLGEIQRGIKTVVDNLKEKPPEEKK